MQAEKRQPAGAGSNQRKPWIRHNWGLISDGQNAQKIRFTDETMLHLWPPFTWRKKWEKTWDEVRFCSQKCRSQKNAIRFHEKTEEDLALIG
jgi:hypothetical protein